MPAKLKIEKILARLPADVTLDVSTYVDTKTKCRFIHEKYGEWFSSPGNVMAGKHHPKYRTERVIEGKTLSSDEILGRIPSHLTLDISTYVNTRIKARFIDKDYGEFWSAPYNVFIGKGHPKRKSAAISEALKYTAEEISQKLPGHISMVHSSYKSIREDAIFRDEKYGDFTAKPGKILYRRKNHPMRTRENYINDILPTRVAVAAKICATMKARYGCEVFSQDPVFAMKAALSCNNFCEKIHWRTGEKLVCQASYESKTVDYLNKNKIEFKWQSEIFDLPLKSKSGKKVTYRPDLYLTGDDKWVEIKGYAREDWIVKWSEFVKIRPNSEIWDSKKLKSMGII